MYILLDIDHTIANAFWRDSMIGSASWDEYHSEAIKDKPFPIIVKLINYLSSQNYTIIAVTGRNEKHRSLTLNWFIENKICVRELLMRPDDDYTKNGELKIKLITEYFKGNFDTIAFAIDDNEEACIAYMNVGITSLQIRNVK